MRKWDKEYREIITALEFTYCNDRSKVRALRRVINSSLKSDKDVVIVKMSKNEASKILHCLQRTNARNSNGELDICEKIEDDIYHQINIKS